MEKVAMLKKAKCFGCGRCCIMEAYVYLTPEEIASDKYKMVEHNGSKVIPHVARYIKEFGCKVNSVCYYFNVSKRTCKLHGKDKPVGCKGWHCVSWGRDLKCEQTWKEWIDWYKKEKWKSEPYLRDKIVSCKKNIKNSKEVVVWHKDKLKNLIKEYEKQFGVFK